MEQGFHPLDRSLHSPLQVVDALRDGLVRLKDLRQVAPERLLALPVLQVRHGLQAHCHVRAEAAGRGPATAPVEAVVEDVATKRSTMLLSSLLLLGCLLVRWPFFLATGFEQRGCRLPLLLASRLVRRSLVAKLIEVQSREHAAELLRKTPVVYLLLRRGSRYHDLLDADQILPAILALRLLEFLVCLVQVNPDVR